MRGELIGGEVIVVPPTTPTDGGARMKSPSALPRPGRIQAALTAQLSPPFDFGRGGPGGWWILTECDVAVSLHDVLTPDVLAYQRARLPVLPEQLPLTLAPDWVCELLSPSSERRDRGVKADLYARAGVGWYWMINPVTRLLEAWARHKGTWRRLGAWTDEQTARIAPFDAIELELGLLFPPRPPDNPTQT
ncbi:MAG: Uma2 family endonuclease [Alphaproteobacteria bacterium]|nr:Uma2 family endonuclease [Alphaproteobacteria bacterium]MCB9796845.1 Uma2 family endonuclease [Alphaproteobacteria bacterium]